MDHDQWAESVQQRVYEYWKQGHDDWEHGVKIFYSPVHSDTDLLLLGFQPGGSGKGSEHEGFENGDFSPPKRNQYSHHTWMLAKKMRELFDGNQDVLENCVASNIVFFGSPTTDEWDSLPTETRSEIEDFCWEQVEGLIERVDPEVILTIGIRTLDQVTDRLKLETQVHQTRGNDRLLASSVDVSPQVVGMIHLTGARISTEDTERLYSGTRQMLGKKLEDFSYES